MITTNTYRDNSWDSAKGLCILLMIIGHCSNLHSWVYTSIESFHMPFFFIAAGYFYREKAFNNFVKNSARRLLMPLLIGTLCCALIALLLQGQESSLSWIKALLFPGGTRRKVLFCANWPNLGVYWFLSALFWCRIIYNEFHKHTHNYLIWICFIISFFFAFASHRLTLPFGVGEGCCGLVFYAFGNLIKEKDLLDKRTPIWCVLIFVALWLVETHFVSFRMFQFGYDYYYPIAVIFACVFSYMLIKVMRMSPLMQGVGIRMVGFYSLEMMCCHQVVRTIIDCSGMKQNYETLLVNCVLIIGTLMLSIIYIGLKKILVCKNS